MKKFCYVAIMLCCVSTMSAFGQRVIILGLDGFGAEGFKGSKHPNIDKLFADGVISLDTRPVMPSVTLPNWTSHLTGAGPVEHDVTSNSWTLQKHELKAFETDADGYYPSIFKVLKEQVRDVKTAFYYNWAELINSTNPKYLDEVSFEANDKYDDNYQKALNFVEKYRQAPTLAFLYTVHIDHAGHKYKWMSPEYISAIEEADIEIGKFVDTLKQKDLYKSTHFILIADHGGTGTGHGGTSMAEMQVPWAITGPKIRNTGLTENLYNSNKNTSLVIARIFGIRKFPESWTGITPKQLFK